MPSVVRAAADGVDVILHQGAQIPQGADSPSERMLDVNARATLSLLEGALASRVPLKRFVLASTYQTYNPFITSRQSHSDEDTPQKPIDIYALTKLLIRGDLPVVTCANTACP